MELVLSRVSKVSERAKDGKPLRVSGTAFNITARKRAKRATPDVQGLHESIDQIFIRDLEGNIIDVNRAAEVTYGWKHVSS